MHAGCEELKSAGLNETEVYELWDVPQRANKIYTEVKPGNSFFVHPHMMVNFMKSHKLIFPEYIQSRMEN